jgi:hypothetical protein
VKLSRRNKQERKEAEEEVSRREKCRRGSTTERKEVGMANSRRGRKFRERKEMKELVGSK